MLEAAFDGDNDEILAVLDEVRKHSTKEDAKKMDHHRLGGMHGCDSVGQTKQKE